MPNPPDQVAFVNTGGTGNIDVGNAFPSISFDNFSPFSFEVWVRFRQAPATSANIVQKQGEFALVYTSAGNISVWRAGMYATLVSSGTVAANQWVHLGITFDGQTLTLYLDGIQDSFVVVTGAGVPNQGYDFILGTGGNADIDTFRMWNTALTAAYMYQAPWAPEPAAGTTGLVANYDLSQTPPVDLSGNNNPITLNAPAASILGAPGVLLAGSAYVDPAEQDFIHCGDTPYTIDAWIYPTSTSGSQALFTSGNLNDPGTVSIWLNNGVLQSQRGTTILAATSGVIPTSTWTHVATTYDGTTLTVYINGTAAGSMAVGSIPSLIDEDALVGAFPTTGGGHADFFQGYIQYISVWSIALNQAQVQALMYNDPTLEPGCAANFAFSQTMPVDLDTGEPLTLQDGAVLSEQMIPWSTGSTNVPRTEARLELPQAMHDRLWRRSLRRANAVTRRVRATRVPSGSVPSWEDHVPLLLDELASVLGTGLSAEERARILKEHEARLRALPDAARPLIGTVTHAIVDDHHVLTLHGLNGPEVVFRAHVDDVDPCTVWFIQFIFTLLWGFAGLLGLTAPVKTKLNQFVTTLIGDLAFMAAVSPLVTGAFTAQSVISFLILLYNNGYLWTFFKFCFTQLTWWGIGRLVLYVVGLFVPAPSPAKVQFFVNVAALVYDLGKLLTNKPC